MVQKPISFLSFSFYGLCKATQKMKIKSESKSERKKLSPKFHIKEINMMHEGVSEMELYDL